MSHRIKNVKASDTSGTKGRNHNVVMTVILQGRQKKFELLKSWEVSVR